MAYSEPPSYHRYLTLTKTTPCLGTVALNWSVNLPRFF